MTEPPNKDQRKKFAGYMNLDDQINKIKRSKNYLLTLVYDSATATRFQHKSSPQCFSDNL